MERNSIKISGVILLSLVITILSITSALAIPESERAALIALYNSTDGDNWALNWGWKDPPLHTDGFAMPGTEDTWYGVTCDTNVVSIKLTAYYGWYIDPLPLPQDFFPWNNNLAGNIPPELGNLTYLESLDLSGNNYLTGAIPAELGNLTNLRRITLKDTGLTAIPAELGNLINLEYLNMYCNQLTAIPGELGNLTNIEELDLSSNNFLTGSIPAELGNLTNLRILDLNYNHLTGPIPAELGNLANLEELLLRDNDVAGSIPAELGSLTNLRELDLRENQLTGSFPAELGNLTNLSRLFLYGNILTGEIPASLTNLNHLSIYDLRYNALYTEDEALITFLDENFGSWNYQTLAPEDVTVGAAGESIVLLQWEPIAFTARSGSYMVYYSETSGGPYELFGETEDKSASRMLVTGLDPLTSYYFIIKTRTDPHSENQNTVYSEESEEVSAVTTVFDSDGDGMANDWEIIYFGGISRNGIEDYDSDGLIDLGEYENGTDPTEADTDDDAMPDGWEIDYELDPLVNDANEDDDGDGFRNLLEYIRETDPRDSGSYPSDAIPDIERAALIALYNNTGGDNWYDNSGWKDAPLHTDGFAMPGTEDTWFGITCDANVVSIVLINYTFFLEYIGNNLVGSIPPELGNLTNLETLDLYFNQLISIPSELGNLTNLEYLRLDHNPLTVLPSELGNLTNLKKLDLQRNQLTAIPAELGNLINLENLYLSGNQLSTIPSELGNLTNLETLSLSSNQLTAIPLELGNLESLQLLYLSGNQLSTIPSELGNLTNLETLSLSFNQLTSIPPELGNLESLRLLNLSGNQLSTIPSELGNLINLEGLDLDRNQLTGTIPAWLGNLTNLKTLDLYENQLTGSITSGLGNLANLYHLNLKQNQLTGTIPDWLGTLTNLRYLYLSGNKLTGPIPESFKNLSELTNLNISYNALYTDDETLLTFLDDLLWRWKERQTVAPEDVTTGAAGKSVVLLQWEPIAYTDDPGSYMVYYSKTSGGPYNLFGETEDKSASQMLVTGLDPQTSYYFIIKTRTDPHSENQNTVYSEDSEEVFAVTTTFDSDGDFMADDWEITYFGGLSRSTMEDYDGDGLVNVVEYFVGTDPTLTDTDNDGMPDGWEIDYELDPMVNDAGEDEDEDGFSNVIEYKRGTDPQNAESYPSMAMPWLPLLLGDD